MKVEWVPLSHVLAPRSGESLDPNAVYPIAGVYGFGRGLLLRSAIRGSDTKYKSMTQLRAGDVVYSKVKAFEGAVTVVGESGAGRFVSPEFPVFATTHERVDTTYLRHHLASESFLEHLRARSSGIGARRERVAPGTFLDLRVPLPSVEDQIRIAAHLDRIDSAAASHGSGGRMSRALAAAMTGLVGSLADSPRIPAGELLARDRSWIEVNESETYSAIGVRGFGRGLIRYPPVLGSGLSKLRYYRLTADRLLLSNIKAWEGAVAMSTTEDVHRVGSNRFLQYRVASDYALLEWLWLYLTSTEGTEQLGHASPGSADRNRTLSMDAFEAIDIPVPSLERQREVVALAERIQFASRLVASSDLLAKALLPAARNEIFNAMSPAG